MGNISVLILTKDEEKNLPGCLASVSWCDDIHVYDSLSSDRTTEIARNFGANVVPRKFDDWASHQNWGLKNIQFRHPWVFYIDADERMTPELISEISDITQQPGNNVAFRVQRRDFFQKRWLKHVQTSPFYVRLFRPEFIRYERLVNPVTLVDGPVGQLEKYLDHFPFSKGMAQWLSRHNSYSTLEADQININQKNKLKFSFVKAIFEKDFSIRRFHQKELFLRLPCRPLIKFLILYFGKRGFMDGKAGFTYAMLQTMYEYMIILKVKELNAGE